MNRTIRNLMDAFVQHLSQKRMQVRSYYHGGLDAEVWLRLEFRHLVDHLRFVRKFSRLLVESRRPIDDGSPLSQAGSPLCIRGETINTWIDLAYFPIQWDLETHVDRIKKALHRLSGGGSGMKVLVWIAISQGKWADKSIEDCRLRIEAAAGVYFESYSPAMLLTLCNEWNDPLEEQIILRLYFGYL